MSQQTANPEGGAQWLQPWQGVRDGHATQPWLVPAVVFPEQASNLHNIAADRTQT